MDRDFLLIIDGSSLLSTQFYGNLPREILFAKTDEEKEKYFYKIMQTSKGVYTNAVYGFLRTLFKIIKDQKPKYLAVTWDISRNTFRRELYTDYKGNRGETLKPLKEQFELCQKVLKEIGVEQFMDERYEADDFSGSLVEKFEKQLPVCILTKDNDYLQLISEYTTVWLMHSTSKKTDELYSKYKMSALEENVPERTFPFNPELMQKEFGIAPSSVPSLKGLQGDSSDNIKGVPGIGEATALALIKEYKTIEALYDEINSLDDTGKKQLAERWKTELGIKRSPIGPLTKEEDGAGEQAARLSKQLATIKRDIDLGKVCLDDLRENIDEKRVAEQLAALEIHSLVFEPAAEESMQEQQLEYTETSDFAEVEKLFADIMGKAAGAADSDKTIYAGVAVNRSEDGILGIAITTSEQKNFYITLEGFITEGYLSQKLFESMDAGVVFTGFDLKGQLDILPCRADGLFDVSVAAYVLNPISGNYDYISLAMEYMGEYHKKLTDDEQSDSRLKQLCLESSLALKLVDILEKQLKETEQFLLFRDIEMPLVITLYEMEKRGIRADRQQLKEYGDRLAEGIERLEKEIYEEVGEEFNINSPKQLGVILFEKLKLPYGKKTKTGYSTSADVLNRLEEEAPIVRKILDYRQLTKLKSTYADGLSKFILEDGRIHTVFNQTITATGRLSSTEPNLQNIPVRMELGREIRKIFTPADGYVFIDADYSQIELRILAHMSKDENLIEAYKSSEDIHRATASLVFHTPLEEVTSEQRSNAKAVNFGIVYGISSFGLGQGLNISRKEAEKYIEQYFESYPKVKEFLDNLVERGRNDGFVTTEYGRRRPIPELASSNFMQRSFGERVAMNSPIQGTAADIIKIAMINVNERLKREQKKSRLLLQIHDELLIEAYESEADEVEKLLYEEMFNAVKLSVPLEVEIKRGMSWYDAK